MLKFASQYTGGAGADVGAAAAGLEHIWGIEHNPQIASVAQANGYPVVIADTRCFDYNDLSRPDWFHASPPCINASTANQNKGETILDMELAQAVCRAIEVFQPEWFSLEIEANI